MVAIPLFNLSTNDIERFVHIRRRSYEKTEKLHKLWQDEFMLPTNWHAVKPTYIVKWHTS